MENEFFELTGEAVKKVDVKAILTTVGIVTGSFGLGALAEKYVINPVAGKIRAKIAAKKATEEIAQAE